MIEFEDTIIERFEGYQLFLSNYETGSKLCLKGNNINNYFTLRSNPRNINNIEPSFVNILIDHDFLKLQHNKKKVNEKNCQYLDQISRKCKVILHH